MTENKLQLSADKTKTMLFNSSKLKHPPAPLSISFLLRLSQEPWFLPRQGFLHERTHQLYMQNCFPGNPMYCTIRHYLNDDATKTCCYFRTQTHCLWQTSFGWSPSVLGRQTSESPKLSSPPCSLCTSTCSHHSITQTSSLVARISYKIACLCFNAITSSTPAYHSDLLHLYSPSRSLRSSADTRLCKCNTNGDHAFSYSGPSVWNSLPLHIRNATSTGTFKTDLKTYLFNRQEAD